MTSLSSYARSLGLAEIAESPEGAVIRLDFAHRLIGRPGFVQGGVIVAVLECAAEQVLRASVGESAHITKLRATFDFLRAGRAEATYAGALVIRAGANSALIDAFAWQDDRANPIAVARCGYMIDRSGFAGSE